MFKFVTIIISFILLAGCQPKNSELLHCWVEGYKGDFDFIAELDELEDQLISQGYLQSSYDYLEYYYLSLNIENNPTEFIDLNISRFLSSDQYFSCDLEMDLSNKDERTRKYGILFSIYHILSKELISIKVEIPNNDQIFVNGQEAANLVAFSQILGKKMDELVKKGISREDILISLMVAAEVKMGVLSKIQQELRELNALKVEYNAPKKEGQMM